MTLVQRRHAFRWGHAIPARLRDRFDCGTMLQKSLTTRDSSLARAFAEYMSATAAHLFRLADNHPQLTRRELELLVENLKSLTNTVTVRSGSRYEGKLLERDLTALNRGGAGARFHHPLMVSLRDKLKAAVRDLGRLVGDEQPAASLDERGAQKLSEVMLEFLKERRLNAVTGTMELRRSCLRAFMMIVGDKSIGEIDRRDLGYFKDVIQKLPVRWERTYRLNNKQRAIVETPGWSPPQKALRVRQPHSTTPITPRSDRARPHPMLGRARLGLSAAKRRQQPWSKFLKERTPCDGPAGAHHCEAEVSAAHRAKRDWSAVPPIEVDALAAWPSAADEPAQMIGCLAGAWLPALRRVNSEESRADAVDYERVAVDYADLGQRRRLHQD